MPHAFTHTVGAASSRPQSKACGSVRVRFNNLPVHQQHAHETAARHTGSAKARVPARVPARAGARTRRRMPHDLSTLEVIKAPDPKRAVARRADDAVGDHLQRLHPRRMPPERGQGFPAAARGLTDGNHLCLKAPCHPTRRACHAPQRHAERTLGPAACQEGRREGARQHASAGG